MAALTQVPVAVALALLFVVTGSGWGWRPAAAQPADAAKWTLVRLSYSGGWDAAPAVVALDRGFFAEEKLSVNGLSRPSEQVVVNSLVAGSTDFAAVPQRTFLVMAAAQVPIKVVSMNGWGTELELAVPTADTATRRLEDLKGKTIGVVTGSEALPPLLRLLNRAKLKPTDVRIRHLTPEQLLQAFNPEAKLADAVFESRHYTTTLVEGGRARIVLPNKDVISAIGVIGAAPLVVRTSVIDKEPATVQRFLNAWVKALAYIQHDPEDVTRLMTVYFHRQGVVNTKPELMKQWLGFTRYTRATWGKDDIADAEYNAWALRTGGLLKTEPKLAPYVDNRFAEQAQKRLAEAGRTPPPAPASR